MDLIEAIPIARQALASGRAGEAERIVQAIRQQRIVGILGEADVGKTTTIHQALRLHDAPVVRLDLDGASSDEHIGFLLAKQIARTVLGETDHSLLSVGVLVPARVLARRQELADLMGLDGLDEALLAWPSGRYTAAAALDAVDRLAQQREITLWIDHAEAPALTPRHPVKVDRLLWGVRELVQRVPRLRVVVSCRAAMEGEVVGRGAAFHQQGTWLPFDVPSRSAWAPVAEALGVSPRRADGLAAAADDHPVTVMLGLLHVATVEKPPDSGFEVLRVLAAADDGLAARAMQHARTLHRLGGQVLFQIALGQRPYGAAQRGAATPQEIRKVLNRLRLAGLLRRNDGWAIVNPLLAIRLRGTVDDPASVRDFPDD